MQRREFEQRQKDFCAFLTARGASLLARTINQWELMRFETSRGIGIVYVNGQGKITLTDEAVGAWKAFNNQGASWTAGEGRKRKNMSPKVRSLIQRDGINCFYCGQPTTEENRNVEHLLSVAHGGNGNLNNLVLTHPLCNQDAGTLSVMEKVQLRERALQQQVPQ